MRVGVSKDGETLLRARDVPTPFEFRKGINLLKALAKQLAGEDPFSAACGGVAGPLNANKTQLMSARHMRGWIGKPLKREIEAFVGSHDVWL